VLVNCELLFSIHIKKLKKHDMINVLHAFIFAQKKNHVDEFLKRMGFFLWK